MTVCNFFCLDFGRDTDPYLCLLDFRNVRIFSHPGRDKISDFAFLPDARTVITGMLALFLYLPR
jgi:hypothetical protein